jgi:hypothetical protein
MVKAPLTISMTTRRIALETPSFGRRQAFVMDAAPEPAPLLSEDFKLFAMTYLAGFLAVSIFLA